MKFNYMVKYDGKYYNAGEEVPIKQKVAKEDKAVETPPSYRDSDITLEEDSAVAEKEYTKTDINKMDKAELQALAAEKSVDGAYDMTGNELKKVLIEMLVG